MSGGLKRKGVEMALTYEMGKLDGIREVVEWLNWNFLACQSNTPSNVDEYIGVHMQSWHTKLREWGVDKPKK